jgi:hypothetical protein
MVLMERGSIALPDIRSAVRNFLEMPSSYGLLYAEKAQTKKNLAVRSAKLHPKRIPGFAFVFCVASLLFSSGGVSAIEIGEPPVCELTLPLWETVAIGDRRKGRLINGLQSRTDNFENVHGWAYSTSADDRQEVAFGTNELVLMLEIVSCISQQKYGIKLTVADRSLADGGITYLSRLHRTRMPPQGFYALPDEDKYMYARHVTHQNGMDADLGYFIELGGELVMVYGLHACGSSSCPGPEDVQGSFKAESALKANWEMLQAMHQTFPLEKTVVDRHLAWHLHDYACRMEPDNPYIDDFFLDCNVPPETDENSYAVGWGGIVEHRDGHATHYHVRIRCPDDDINCLELPAGRGIGFELLQEFGFDVLWR